MLMEQPKLLESKCPILFTSEFQRWQEEEKKKKKENVYAKFLKFKTLLKKVIELE